MRFIIITVLLISCAPTTRIVDNDDLYFNNSNRDTVVLKKVRWNIKPSKVHYVPDYGWYAWRYNYGFGYGYPYQYYQPRTIIVVPKNSENYNYGKRPSREGNVSSPSPRRSHRD